MRTEAAPASRVALTLWVASALAGCGGTFLGTGAAPHDEAAVPLPPGRGVYHAEAAGKPSLESDAGELESTVVVAGLRARIEPGRNVLWCNTFQLAWNELCEHFGEDVTLEGGPPIVTALVTALNEKLSTKDDIDRASYVALAGPVADGILDKVKKALHDRFGGLASPRLVPKPEGLAPTDIVAYAYLFKNLRFAIPYENSHRIRFTGKPVRAFGIEEHGRKTARMGRQVVIHDYVASNDFVIELRTRSRGDRLVLAKVKPAETLHETVRAVLERVGVGRPEKMVKRDILKIPKLNFNVTRRYDELIDLDLTNPKGMGYFIRDALQNLRFRLDEKGAVLKSEARLIVKKCEKLGPGPKHVMVFAGPFLILMLREGRSTPYFALWVATPELLVPCDERAP